jgi:hypothetical protein
MIKSQDKQSFVARIWLETTDEENPKWRGHIQHIQGQEETYFQDLTKMSEFMTQVSGVSGLDFNEDRDNVVSLPSHTSQSCKKPKPGSSDE